MSWIDAMEKNLDKMENDLDNADKLKFSDDIRNNRDHLNSLKNKILLNGESMLLMYDRNNG